MFYDITAESVTIIIGMITLIIGVINSVITNRQTVKSHRFQIILAVSDTFRNEWDSSWCDTLDELEVDHLSPRREELTDAQEKNIRTMLNWVDWLGAMKSSGALKELNILTSSIGAPIKRIINAGYTIVEADTKEYGANYWRNLFVVARHLDLTSTVQLEHKHS